ncbi:MAG: hypothetical protein Q7T34_01460 [Candidatus Parcubacteria bacterium]|nr:hypothetical protein [Candidatus Parcubacteria bacterium]
MAKITDIEGKNIEPVLTKVWPKIITDIIGNDIEKENGDNDKLR